MDEPGGPRAQWDMVENGERCTARRVLRSPGNGLHGNRVDWCCSEPGSLGEGTWGHAGQTQLRDSKPSGWDTRVGLRAGDATLCTQLPRERVNN